MSDRDFINELVQKYGDVVEIQNIQKAEDIDSFMGKNFGKIYNSPQKIIVFNNELKNKIQGFLIYNLNFSKIDKIINLNELIYLDISNNSLHELPEWLGNLTQLTSLDIGYTYLEKLPEWLGNLKKLKRLDLSNLTIPAIPKSIAFLYSKAKTFANHVGAASGRPQVGVDFADAHCAPLRLAVNLYVREYRIGFCI